VSNVAVGVFGNARADYAALAARPRRPSLKGPRISKLGERCCLNFLADRSDSPRKAAARSRNRNQRLRGSKAIKVILAQLPIRFFGCQNTLPACHQSGKISDGHCFAFGNRPNWRLWAAPVRSKGPLALVASENRHAVHRRHPERMSPIFDRKLARGFAAGNIGDTFWAVGATRVTTGVDCPSLASRVWKLGQHIATADLNRVTSPVPEFNDIREGDAFLRAGSHAMLDREQVSPDGGSLSIRVTEASSAAAPCATASTRSNRCRTSRCGGGRGCRGAARGAPRAICAPSGATWRGKTFNHGASLLPPTSRAGRRGWRWLLGLDAGRRDIDIARPNGNAIGCADHFPHFPVSSAMKFRKWGASPQTRPDIACRV
jgi:hypothetical protein